MAMRSAGSTEYKAEAGSRTTLHNACCDNVSFCFCNDFHFGLRETTEPCHIDDTEGLAIDTAAQCRKIRLSGRNAAQRHATPTGASRHEDKSFCGRRQILVTICHHFQTARVAGLSEATPDPENEWRQIG
ncbi:MAG: hypothetical protein WD711_06905 [Dongiaceae bacterium]